jgi:isoleucyl-tRNA synthetase
MTHGMVLDVSKKKMSKSLGNAVQPSEVIAKYNRDYLRYYLAKTSKGEDISFDWNAFSDIQKFFNILWNSFNFVSLYFNFTLMDSISLNDLEPEDKWLVLKANSIAKKSIDYYNNYTFFNVVNLIEEFVLEDLSRTYIKLIRDRINEKSSVKAGKALSYTLMLLLKILAPIMPHMTEFVYQKFKDKKMPESIHLTFFPEIKETSEMEALDKEMNLIKSITQEVLAIRNQENLRLRWPLYSLVIESKKQQLNYLTNVLMKLCNVKQVIQVKEKPKGNFASKEINEIKIHLSLEIDQKLKKEWELRELIRFIQETRKKLSFNPNERKKLFIDSDDRNFLSEFKNEIEKETNTLIEFSMLPKKEKLIEKSFAIKFEA